MAFFFSSTAVTAIPLAPHPHCVTQSQASVCVGPVSRAKCAMPVKWDFLPFPPEAAEVHNHIIFNVQLMFKKKIKVDLIL